MLKYVTLQSDNCFLQKEIFSQLRITHHTAHSKSIEPLNLFVPVSQTHFAVVVIFSSLGCNQVMKIKAIGSFSRSHITKN